MNIKRTFVIVAIILIILISALFLYFRRAENTAGPVTQTRVAQPVFPSLPAAQPAYSLALPAPSPFPSFLQNYKVGGAATTYTSRFSGVAKNLGFTGPVNVIVISRGNFSTWSQEQKTLLLGGDPLEISYNSGLQATGVVSDSVDILEQAARTFVEKAGIGSPNTTLSRESVDYFTPKGSLLNPQPNSSGATLVQINFRYLIDNRPLYTRQANTPSISVIFNSSGQIVSLSGNWFPGLSKATGSTSLLSYQNSQSRLTNGQGVLVSLSSARDFNSENSPQYNLTASSINDVVLGYYYSRGNQSLAPVYVFTGSGADANTEAAVATITLVSALP